MLDLAPKLPQQRQIPSLSPEDNERIVREAIDGVQKWDVQEDINNRRQAEELARPQGHAQDGAEPTERPAGISG